MPSLTQINTSAQDTIQSREIKSQDNSTVVSIPLAGYHRQDTANLSQIDSVKVIDQSAEIEVSVSMTKGAFESFVKGGSSD